MTKRTAFYQAGIVEGGKFGIMNCCGLSELFRSLMKSPVKLFEMVGKRSFQFLCLGSRELLLHDITVPYLPAGLLNGLPIRYGQSQRDGLHTPGNLTHFCPEQIEYLRR